MQESIRAINLLVFIVILLVGCSPGSDLLSTPTRTGEEVISTARVFAELTRQATAQTPPPTPITPSPTVSLDTATPEPTFTPDMPIVTADMNARVRSGPDEVFDIVDFLLVGDSARVIGRYENSLYEPTTWWLIQRIDEGKDGWVWSGTVRLMGNELVIPILESPPTPEQD